MRGIGNGAGEDPREPHPRVTARTVRRTDEAPRVRSPARDLPRPVPSWVGWAVALLGLAVLVGAPASAAGQSSSTPSLEAAVAAADSGAVERAREMLDAWIATRQGSATADQRDRARFLEARLAQDPDSARRLYARLAVEASSEIGARARLRLAQLRLARGETDAALGDLELVRADFPGSPAAAESWLWTGRAHRAAGAPAAACRAFGRAERAAAGAGLGELRREAEASRAACDGDGPAAGEPAGEAGAAGTRWVVQLGAFRDRSAAEDLRERAEEAGFQARIVTGGDPPGLHRVRVGRFGDRAAAEAVARRLEERGFRALIAESAGTEGGS